MLKPNHIEVLWYLYAAGNTPAVSLVRSLPPSQDAALLLLGCGDARNILFTAYSRHHSERGRLDITCCDLQVEIIARNAVLYTLLLDDQDGQNSRLIWNIYYHTMLDPDSLNLLSTQAQKLEGLAGSIKQWREGPYGDLLRFCDTSTFKQVVRLWNLYAVRPAQGQAFRDQQQNLRAGLQRAQHLRKKKIGNHVVLTGVRSAAPCEILAFADINSLASDYWKTGIAVGDRQTIADSKYHNPMFAMLSSTQTLHYGTDPFLGFHLATGYAPLAKDSPLHTRPSKAEDLKAAAKAALSEFQAWGESFRKARGQLVIRFVFSDALAFCHVLQHHRIHQESKEAFWYRDRWHYEQLILDSEEYAPRGSAPTTFDVIDTSNLVDHLGCLNILAGCAPLLANRKDSAIYTEMLVLREENVEAYAKGLLCGDIPTVSLIFGLQPTQYWTNMDTSSTFADSMLDMIGGADKATQSRYIMVWKSTARSTVKFDDKELACFIYNMYLQMFQDESWANRLSITPAQLMRKGFEHYTRASLSVILRLIKQLDLVDWNTFIQLLIEKIEDDRVLNMGRHYLQELYVHLHLFGLQTKMVYEPDMLGFGSSLKDSILRDWRDIPSTVCLTVAVPRQKLRVFQKKSPTEIGSPICHLQFQSPHDGRQNIFPDIQLGFGDIRTSGTRYTKDFTLYVDEDEREWQGKKPLLVSAIVPTWLVLYHADLSTQVAFALKTSPMSMQLAGELGMFLEIHKTTLANKDVFLTLHPPNLDGRPSVSCLSRFPGPQSTSSRVGQPGLTPTEPSVLIGSKITFHASLDGKATRINGLRIHFDLVSTKGEDLLRSDAVVSCKQLSPFKMELDIAAGSFCEAIQLPVPLVMSGGKTRIARKSCYVEFIAAVASPESLSCRPDSMFPLLRQAGVPILENMPYLALDRLPILNLQDSSKLKWMTTHLTAMFSARERSEREKSLTSNDKCKDVRANFKDSLFSMFSHIAGIGGAHQGMIFGINNPAAGGFHLLIFASSVRLDLSSQSITLDAALLPLTRSVVASLNSLLSEVQGRGIISVIVDDEELILWKHAVPAFIERCRDWEHASSCEYAADHASVPLSTKVGDDFVCSCGLGKFPKDYRPNVPLWNKIARHCTRAAIMPCFSVPFVEKSVELPPILPTDAVEQATTQMKNLMIDKNVCFACKGTGDGGGRKLSKCGACKVVSYCSKECQVKDWKHGGHQKVCKALAAAKD